MTKATRTKETITKKRQQQTMFIRLIATRTHTHNRLTVLQTSTVPQPDLVPDTNSHDRSNFGTLGKKKKSGREVKKGDND